MAEGLEPCYLHDLDDACLLNILKHLDPWPDLFRLAQTCWKFRRLLLDQHMWLVVAPEPAKLIQAPPGKLFSTLGSAVLASRPGDTIWLAPGMTHTVRDLVLSKPLHLRGGGQCAEDTQLVCPVGAETGLDFRSTCKVTNLSMRSHRAPCIIHRGGQLSLERCLLRCDTRGMDHLFAPLVTAATLHQPVLPKLAFMGAAEHLMVASPGRLTVAETRFIGGSQAVDCRGSGALSGVRAIYGASAAHLWFEVDCRMPGVIHNQKAFVRIMHSAPQHRQVAVFSGRQCAALTPLCQPQVNSTHVATADSSDSSNATCSTSHKIHLHPNSIQHSADHAVTLHDKLLRQQAQHQQADGLERIQRLLAGINPAAMQRLAQARSSDAPHALCEQGMPASAVSANCQSSSSTRDSAVVSNLEPAGHMALPDQVAMDLLFPHINVMNDPEDAQYNSLQAAYDHVAASVAVSFASAHSGLAHAADVAAQGSRKKQKVSRGGVSSSFSHDFLSVTETAMIDVDTSAAKSVNPSWMDDIDDLA